MACGCGKKPRRVITPRALPMVGAGGFTQVQYIGTAEKLVMVQDAYYRLIPGQVFYAATEHDAYLCDCIEVHNAGVL